MSEQGLSFENSPADAGPEQAPGVAEQNSQAEVDWQKRYVDTQEAYTRGQQEIAEIRRRDELKDVLLFSDDRDVRRQAALELGYELDDDTVDEQPYSEDPYESLAQRQERLEQRFAQQDEQAQQEVETNFITDYAHSQLDQLGIPRTDEETRQMIFERALSLPNLSPSPGMPVGWLPDLQAAYEQFQAWEDNRMKAWAKTKRAPFVPPGGRDATEAPDPGTGHNARMNRALLFLRNNAGDDE